MAAKTFSSSSPSSSSSSSSSNTLWIYDVFLSFRGKDTRKKFTDHLYHALKDAGIETFRDDNELPRGEDISSELVKAIQGSRISVIVFSTNYAASRWCLEELMEIMETKRILGQMVLPIFYDVDLSYVRHQKGSLAEAFVKHEERFVLQMDKVGRWKAALSEVADLSGWNLKKVADGYEAKFIKKIVDEILETLKHISSLEVGHHLIGIDLPVREMNLLLNIESNDVRMVGIWGMGGIGKTTIAKAIFNKLFYNFERRSFITSVKKMGKVQLQERFLSYILTGKEIKIGDVDRGINMIKKKLSEKRVILILDDVDELDQINVVAGSRDWFGSGSRISITTRDQDLLTSMNEIYMVKEMNHTNSLKLFSLHVFGKNDPTADYVKLAEEIVAYSGGLPLALKVLGSFLSNKSIPEWKSALAKLRHIPDKDIVKKLRISYDSLRDNMEKNIFLDISCFFIGMDKDYVIQILDGCGFHAVIGLCVLINRCLVMINNWNELLMHNLLRDMGREIIREECLIEPGQRSRLWRHEDVINMLTNETGTRAIEGITLKLPEVNDVSMDTKQFSKLQKLKLLQLHHVRLNGGYENFSEELRWLSWHGCPLKFIPNDFYLGNLVAIDLQHSNLREIWKNSTMVLEKLKFLDLSHSQQLTRIPDFSNLPNLVELKLQNCTQLVEIPWNFCKLKSLQSLNLSGCLKLDKLPQDLGILKSSAALVQRMMNLPQFSLCGCTGSLSNSLVSHLWSWRLPRRSPPVNLLASSLQGLSCLQKLHLSNCNLSDDAIPTDFWGLSSLEALDLAGNNFLGLPTGIRDLSKLHFLGLDNCKRLKAIEDLPASLNALEARNCNSLESLPDLKKCRYFNAMSFHNCSKLIEGGRLDILRKPALVIPYLEGERRDNTSEEGQLLQEWDVTCYGGIFLPGNEIPDWFAYKEEGSSICFYVPGFAGYELLTLDVCCVVSGYEDATVISDYVGDNMATPVIELRNHSKGYLMRIGVRGRLTYQTRSQEDHLWRAELHTVDVNVGGEDKVEIGVNISKEITVKKIGVHLHFKIRSEESKESDDDEEVIQDKAEGSNDSDDEEATKDDAGIKAKRGLDEDGAEPSCDVELPAKRLKCDDTSGKRNAM